MASHDKYSIAAMQASEEADARLVEVMQSHGFDKEDYDVTIRVRFKHDWLEGHTLKNHKPTTKCDVCRQSVLDIEMDKKTCTGG